MAGLSNAEVQKLFQERPRRREIEDGVRHQQRLRFHTETVVDKQALRSNPYYNVFINWICSEKPELLPKDKVERFIQLITVPLPTIELTESIFSHLGNVFRGQDAFNRYVFSDPAKEEDWKSFVNYEFWRTQGFQAMINGIDSVWVLDLPAIQDTELPQPTDRLIDITNVIDIKCDVNNVCEWVIFRVGEKVYQYDSEYIRVYKADKNEISKLPEVEISHGLGYCPARMFWSDPISTGNYINKKAPLTNVLGDLDWHLVVHVFKKYMEIANSYPILAAYEQADDFRESKQEENRGRPEEERRPEGGNLLGPGSILTIRPPLAGEPDAMANPLKFISPDVATLQYHVDHLALKRDDIFYSVVGKDEQTTKEAVNEKQVMASFESQTAILLKIAKNFKMIQEFAEKCKADIRYGVGQLVEISIDYGTKFFLKSAADLIEDLNTAKQNGSHASVISAIMGEIIEAKYRNDKSGLTRAQIIQELDPLPDKTQDEAEKIFTKGAITKEQYIIKCNLMSFVKRFEREQAPLTEFASKRPYAVKIALIMDEFLKYVQELKEIENPVQLDAEGNPIEDVAKTALNGAQISSLLEIVQSISTGVLSPESAKIVLQAAFPTFTIEQVNGIVNNLSRDVKKGISGEGEEKAPPTTIVKPPNKEIVEEEVLIKEE